MRILAVLSIAVYLTLSILASVQPQWFEFVQGIPGRDKLIHFLGAGVLSTFMVAGFSSIVVRNRRYGTLATLGATALLITLEEFAQLAVASRTFDAGDLYWSYLGIAVFGLSAAGLRRTASSAS